MVTLRSTAFDADHHARASGGQPRWRTDGAEEPREAPRELRVLLSGKDEALDDYLASLIVNCRGFGSARFDRAWQEHDVAGRIRNSSYGLFVPLLNNIGDSAGRDGSFRFVDIPAIPAGLRLVTLFRDCQPRGLVVTLLSRNLVSGFPRRALDAGAHHHLDYPFDVDEFCATLEGRH